MEVAVGSGGGKGGEGGEPSSCSSSRLPCGARSAADLLEFSSERGGGRASPTGIRFFCRLRAGYRPRKRNTVFGADSGSVADSVDLSPLDFPAGQRKTNSRLPRRPSTTKDEAKLEGTHDTRRNHRASGQPKSTAARRVVGDAPRNGDMEQTPERNARVAGESEFRGTKRILGRT